MWLLIGGIILFSFGYHLGKIDEKEKQTRRKYKCNDSYYYPPSVPLLEYQQSIAPPASAPYLESYVPAYQAEIK